MTSHPMARTLSDIAFAPPVMIASRLLLSPRDDLLMLSSEFLLASFVVPCDSLWSSHEREQAYNPAP